MNTSYQQYVNMICANKEFFYFLKENFAHYQIVDSISIDDYMQTSSININEFFIIEDNKIKSLCRYLLYKPYNYITFIHSSIFNINNQLDMFHNNISNNDHYRFLLNDNKNNGDNTDNDIHIVISYWQPVNLYNVTIYKVVNDEIQHIKLPITISENNFINDLIEYFPNLTNQLLLIGAYLLILKM